MTDNIQGVLVVREGRSVIEMVLPLPPTDNNIYRPMKVARKSKWPGTTTRFALTDEARAYKTRVASAFACLALRHQIVLPQDTPFLVKLRLFFHTVENKGWSTGKAKTRYKKVDTTNRHKLLIDAVAQAIGIDDSSIFTVIKLKDQCDQQPRVELGMYELRPGELPHLYHAVEDCIERYLWD